MKPLIVVYYHRILPFKGYDIDLSTFEWQLSFFSKHFEIVGADTLQRMKEGEKLSKTSVLITFDDGFFDNYVYAYPLLKKYSAKALLFVPTSKITSGKKRKTLEDYWKSRIEFNKLDKPEKKENALYSSLGGNLKEFLHWEEIEEMVASGVFELGSHGHIHSKVFSSENVIDFYEGNNVHWSFAYANNKDLRRGVPVFEMKSSLACRRFEPNDEFKLYCMDIYSRYNNTKEALEKVNEYKNRGKYEDDFQLRMESELKTSKELIKKNLGIDTKFLSWPWGEYCNNGVQIAKKLGFEFCFTTKKSAFLKGDFCKIGRIKAPDKKIRFIRKMFLNSNRAFAELYTKTHR